MKQKPSNVLKDKNKTGYQVWHLALTVPALAIVLQVMLGSLTPLPDEHNPYQARYAAAHTYRDYDDYPYEHLRQNRLPDTEILPMHLRGEMTGPLLASVLQEYFPESTTEHAVDLRDTLPPGENPRMIVILPKDGDDKKPVF